MTITKAGSDLRATRAHQNQWLGEVKDAAKTVKLASFALTSARAPGAKAPTAFAALVEKVVKTAVDALTMLLEKRFDTPLTKTQVQSLTVSQNQLDRAGGKFRQLEKALDHTRLPPDAQPFKEQYFGDVGNAARMLATEANTSGKAQFVDFNGTLLIARPGQGADAAQAEWSAAMHSNPSPIGDLSWQIESRANDEAAKADIAKVARQKPRDIGTVLKDIDSKIAKGEYKSPFLAGLCELKHPAEIEAFTQHFAANPERKDPGQPLAEAQATAKKNLVFWVKDRGGAVSGTEDTWLKAAERAFPAPAKAPLSLEPMAGDNIDGHIAKMIAAANKEGRPVVANFNSTDLVANPGDDAKTVKAPFQKRMDEGAAKYAAAQAQAATERAAKLDAFKAGGGTLITDKPKDLDLSQNAKGWGLTLLRPEQLEKLPPGTVLHSISGREAVVGVDRIDDDTRGGHLAFGFKS